MGCSPPARGDLDLDEGVLSAGLLARLQEGRVVLLDRVVDPPVVLLGFHFFTFLAMSSVSCLQLGNDVFVNFLEWCLRCHHLLYAGENAEMSMSSVRKAEPVMERVRGQL